MSPPFFSLLFFSALLVLLPSASSFAEDSATSVVQSPNVAPPNVVPASEALATYVKKPDASYQWKKIRAGKVGDTEYVELILTSQTWQDTIWKHRLFIMKPSTLDDSKQAMLVIAGGRWKKEYENPDKGKEIAGMAMWFFSIAEKIKSPVAVLLQVPQQPLFGGVVEDELISLSFEKYLNTRDVEWPLLLPMVKSTVRGMDAIQEFCSKQWALDIKTFTVTGASKRGWTTWLTGAVEPRATALAPMVIDMLSMGLQMKHQREVWGSYSEQIKDYTELDLQKRLETPAGKELQKIVDPYAYRKSLTQPKLIILGTNDRYWPVDALNLYWEGLVGENCILNIPNNGHGLRDLPRLTGGLTALHEHARGGRPMPKLSWGFQQQETGLLLHAQSDEPISDFKIWTATSKTRDFRDSKWTTDGSIAQRAEAYQYTGFTPDDGYRAFFGEAVYEREDYTFYLSTNVKIISALAEKDYPAR